MITLTIKRQDGSIYWVEHFSDQVSADNWLAEEKTRPYWDNSFSTSFVDDTPPPPSAAEIAAAQAAKADLAAKVQAIKSFAAAAPGGITPAQVLAALQNFMAHYIKINGL